MRSYLLCEVHHDRFRPANDVDGSVGTIEHQRAMLPKVVILRGRGPV